MHSSLPSVSWGSLSPLSATEAPHGDLHFVASFLPEDGFFDCQGHDGIPSLDDSVFDLDLVITDPIPDLEEVFPEDLIDVPLLDGELLLDEIPALEDADQVDWNRNQLRRECPKIMTPVMFEEPVEPVEEEVVVSPASSPVAIYVESCGSSSPLSCYSLASDDSPAEKRRRISQISNASFSSSASGSWASSPQTTSSDSDYEPVARRGGRKSRYTEEDRRERKKAQNRTAAERYRMKKKVQEDTVTEEERQLMDANQDLKTEVTKLEAEVSCLKKLMKEMLLAKGVVIPSKK